MLQNQLRKNLPEGFTANFPDGTAIAYATIPLISQLEEPLKTQVRVAFAESLKVVWEVLGAITGLGLISSFLMRALPLHTAVDEKWGLQDSGEKEKEAEAEGR